MSFAGIETVTGKIIDLLNPTPDQIDIQDIAWALSRTPRLTGHTISMIPPNNADHSIFVMQEVKELIDSIINGTIDSKSVLCAKMMSLEFFKNPITLKQYYGILLKSQLHDAQEYVTGDIPSPMKRIPELRKVIKEIENKLDLAIFSSFGMEPISDDEKYIIKYADIIAQRIEMYNYMPSRGANIDWTYDGIVIDINLDKLQKYKEPTDAVNSYRNFLEHFNCLQEKYIKAPNIHK